MHIDEQRTVKGSRLAIPFTLCMHERDEPGSKIWNFEIRIRDYFIISSGNFNTWLCIKMHSI